MVTPLTSTQICFFCSQSFAAGGGHWGGRWLPCYQISVCNSCFNSNWDGWHLDAEEKLVKHLQEKGIALPKRNEKGWLPQSIIRD
jgi:hypothetical protein